MHIKKYFKIDFFSFPEYCFIYPSSRLNFLQYPMTFRTSFSFHIINQTSRVTKEFFSLSNHTKAKYFANRTIFLLRPKPSHSLSYSSLTFITKKFQKNCQRKLVKKKNRWFSKEIERVQNLLSRQEKTTKTWKKSGTNHKRFQEELTWNTRQTLRIKQK